MDGFTASSRISPGGRVLGTFCLEIKVPVQSKKRSRLTHADFTYWFRRGYAATIRNQSNRCRSPS